MGSNPLNKHLKTSSLFKVGAWIFSAGSTLPRSDPISLLCKLLVFSSSSSATQSICLLLTAQHASQKQAPAP